MHWFLKFNFEIKLYMFRTVPLSNIRSFPLYTQQWYKSHRFADYLSAGSGRSSFLILLASCQQTCMTYTIAIRKLSANLYDIYHCYSQAASKPVWHIPLLLASCQQTCMTYTIATRKLSANLYDIYHCYVYKEKLLMLDRGTVRNM